MKLLSQLKLVLAGFICFFKMMCLHHYFIGLAINLFFFISPDESPSRQGISETEFMERIRERMAQEVGGYVS